MSASFVFPPLGESVAQGTITRWLKRVGDLVVEGEPLVEIATDKVDTEVTAPFTGALAEILVQENFTAEVGQVLATYVDATAAVPASDGPPPAAEVRSVELRPHAEAAVARPPASGGTPTVVVEVDVTRAVRSTALPGSVDAAIADARARVRADATFAAGIHTATLADAGGRGALLEIPALPAGQAAALGVGAVVRRVVPVGDGDAIGIRSFAQICLTYRDELIDPTEAARYLAEVRRIVESGALG